MNISDVITQYSSLEKGIAYVESKLQLGHWSIHEQDGNWWLHTNPNREADVCSVYESSRQAVIELHVWDWARHVGYNWVFEE